MKHPHLLLITIDSLRADHLGCYGHTGRLTPALDAFATSGVRFAEHLTSIAVTLSSHASLLTGCTPMVHGVTWNGMCVPRRRRTLPEIAAEAGYATTAITSWGGFAEQEVYGFKNWYSQGAAAAEANRGDYTLARVLDWIASADTATPQLLWIHFIDPHAPDNCPAPYPACYEGEVAFVDTLVGKVIRAWDDRLEAGASLVAITADHGEHLDDHGIPRGHGTLWEVNLHVPLLIRAPGLIPSETVVPELTRQIDVLPTLLDYARLPMPYDLEGMSLRGLIQGTESNLRLVHHAQAIGPNGNAMTIRNAEYSMHYGDGQQLAHLFDRRNDPTEELDMIQGGAVIRHSAAHSIADSQQK